MLESLLTCSRVFDLPRKCSLSVQDRIVLDSAKLFDEHPNGLSKRPSSMISPTIDDSDHQLEYALIIDHGLRTGQGSHFSTYEARTSHIHEAPLPFPFSQTFPVIPYRLPLCLAILLRPRLARNMK
jgi:hypothetical protein